MGRVGCARTVSSAPEHHGVGTEQIVEPVPADGELVPEVTAAQLIKLAASGLGKTAAADVLTIQDDAGGEDVLLVLYTLMLIVSL